MREITKSRAGRQSVLSQAFATNALAGKNSKEGQACCVNLIK